MLKKFSVILCLFIGVGYFFFSDRNQKMETEAFKEAIDYKANTLCLEIEDSDCELDDEGNLQKTKKSESALLEEINSLVETKKVVEYHSKELQYDTAKKLSKETKARIDGLINSKTAEIALLRQINKLDTYSKEHPDEPVAKAWEEYKKCEKTYNCAQEKRIY